jgi:hypothetical protein
VNADVKLPHWEGWHLIGAFPDHEPGDVGSWLLTDGGEAMLLEVPDGLTVGEVRQASPTRGRRSAACGCPSGGPTCLSTDRQ